MEGLQKASKLVWEASMIVYNPSLPRQDTSRYEDLIADHKHISASIAGEYTLLIYLYNNFQQPCERSKYERGRTTSIYFNFCQGLYNVLRL